MANLSEDIQCAGFDTRPPMLDKADFASWQQRIRLYCRGKDNGVNILKSIDEGPFQMGTTRVTVAEGTEGPLNLGPERPRVYSDLSQDEKDRYNADIRATNIILQGLPKDIYSLINHYTDAKDIWDNVKMLLEGSELTKEDRESQLYDDFEHFRQNKGETIHNYYVRFAKLINDMRNIKMTMSKIQLNSKFVNNMLPEWGRFVTAVKLNKGLKDSNFDQLYAYLKQHEAHANENKMMLERLTQQTVDPLALMSNVSPQHYHSQSSTNPPTTYHQPQSADTPQSDLGLSPTDNLIENLTNTLALLTQSYKTFLPQTNNQLRTSSNPRNQATIQDGRVVVQNVQGRQNRGQGNNARGAGAVGYEGAHNRVGNANPGQVRQVKTMLLMNMLMKQPVQDLALKVDNVFHAEERDVDLHTTETTDPEQIFWSQDIVKMKAEALKEQNTRPINALTVYPPNTPATLVPRVLPTKSQVKYNIFTLRQLFSKFKKICKKRITPTEITEGERGFEQTKTCYLTEVIPFFKTLQEHFEGIQKALTKEVKEMSDAFDELEAELDQSIVDRKHDEIERKNLLIEHDNIIADGLSKEVFYVASNSELNVSRFTEMQKAHNVVKARCLELEAKHSNLRDNIHKDNYNELLNGFPYLAVNH
ncbi:hypothetical protein Tco_0289466 [Tanacetum coccineum]